MDAIIGASLGTIGLALLICGLAPRLVLQLIVRMWPAGSDRRAELFGEIGAVDYLRRPFWICDMFALGLTEGVPSRLNEIDRESLIRWLARGAQSRVLAILYLCLASGATEQAIITSGPDSVIDAVAAPVIGLTGLTTGYRYLRARRLKL